MALLSEPTVYSLYYDMAYHQVVVFKCFELSSSGNYFGNLTTLIASKQCMLLNKHEQVFICTVRPV